MWVAKLCRSMCGCTSGRSARAASRRTICQTATRSSGRPVLDSSRTHDPDCRRIEPTSGEVPEVVSHGDLCRLADRDQRSRSPLPSTRNRRSARRTRPPSPRPPTREVPRHTSTPASLGPAATVVPTTRRRRPTGISSDLASAPRQSFPSRRWIRGDVGFESTRFDASRNRKNMVVRRRRCRRAAVHVAGATAGHDQTRLDRPRRRHSRPSRKHSIESRSA